MESVLLISILACFTLRIGSSQLVPAIITFGDSSVDVGNNDYLSTVFRADFPPYGRDFAGKVPTGRFCNGKLATDIIADTLGFTKYPPAYLSPEASGSNLLIGVNLGSAGSGFDDKTSLLSLRLMNKLTNTFFGVQLVKKKHVIPLSKQLEYFSEYKAKLTQLTGEKNATTILSGALYIVSFGSSDFLQNYYINPLLQKLYTTPNAYASYLVGIFSNLVSVLYGMGARKIGVTSLPPLGCVPAAITLFGFGQNVCVQRLNNDARGFNVKINAAVDVLGKEKQFSKLKLAVFDIYTPLLKLVNKPYESGFAEARRGCCGTGILETTSLLCNRNSIGTCTNATQYVFWDGVHPSEAANQLLADSLIMEGITLIS
ncbi:GDSL esterase/lipase APG [Zostera marina]|uniref:GDSL esterase/lipase APG n=1 Tax=Zostera marina TaxID=29655 RepID=A0A0K9NHR9_ZOSMR|nr:GDSL esterase/lipase APG [Zostera marina]